MTGVPIGTRGYRSSESEISIRMHPCDAAVPIDDELHVPWIRIPGAFRYIARVPSGFPGPGGIDAGRSAPQPVGSGLTQVGFSLLSTISNVPTGVSWPGVPVATRYSRTTLRPS